MIHLVHMPFGSVTHPSLALGVIKAQLADAGMVSRVFNFNLDFASRIGFPAYETLALLRWEQAQVGEWLFTEAAWRDEATLSDDAFLRLAGSELATLPTFGDPDTWIRRVRHVIVPEFLEGCLAQLRAAGPVEIVGFTCNFFQTVASLALARRIREEHPDARLVFGGACFHDEMGEELLRGTPWIDAVSLGETDDVVVPLFQALRDGRRPALPGIAWRDRATGALTSTPPHAIDAPVLEALPHPDYAEYFSEIEDVGLLWDADWKVRAFLPFDSARGCWWGQKHHCTFCGLNGATMAFRAKSGARVYDTFATFVERYPLRRFHAADNILPLPYFRDLLPRLATDPPAPDLQIFYEIKPNLTIAQVRALGAAGIRYVQPGIESLSTHLLECFRKGITGLQNVHFLKACRIADVLPLWNLLLGVPGEREEDYAQMTAWLPLLQHLQPPIGGPRNIELHRFSPYFSEPGFTATKRPRPWYRGLYPPGRFDVSRVAYYFEAEWNDVLPDAAYDPLREATRRWMHRWATATELPRLTAYPRPDGGIDVLDTRHDVRTWSLDPVQAVAYGAIEAPGGVYAVQKAFRAAGLEEPDAAVRALLETFVKSGLALQEGNAFLALALPPEAPEPDLALRRQSYHPDPGKEAPA